MKLVSISFLVGIAIVAAGSGAAEETARVVVTVEGLSSVEGSVALAVFDTEESYEHRKDAVDKAFVPVEGDVVTWQTSLPVDRRYVVLAYHDVNGNGSLDTRAFGIPKEPVGIYRDARRGLRPPGFEEASFEIASPRVDVHIRLR